MAHSGEIPAIANSARNSTSYDASSLATGYARADRAGGIISPHPADLEYLRNVARRFEKQPDAQQGLAIGAANIQQGEAYMRRLVQVIIVDNNESVPLEHAVLHRSAEKFTDLDDQELFFEIDIMGLLTTHNERRITWRNKKVKDREEMLEPARIRDLKMVVVEVARF